MSGETPVRREAAATAKWWREQFQTIAPQGSTNEQFDAFESVLAGTISHLMSENEFGTVIGIGDGKADSTLTNALNEAGIEMSPSSDQNIYTVISLDHVAVIVDGNSMLIPIP